MQHLRKTFRSVQHNQTDIINCILHVRALQDCDPWEYQCPRTGQCVNKENFCDGVADCALGDDEYDGCSTGVFGAEPRSASMNKTYTLLLDEISINSQFNQRAMLDECIHVRLWLFAVACDAELQFSCAADDVCLRSAQRCNYEFDCSDRSDEHYCGQY